MGTQPTNPVSTRCRRCGSNSPLQAKYCADCGLDLHQTRKQETTHPHAPEGSSGNYIRWIIAALVFLAVLWLVGTSSR